MAAIYTPILTLPFAASRRVSPLVTFTRSSTGTYWGPGGVMRTAAANAPRIDHDPATGECRGLLLEGQRTNLITYSAELDNAAWVKAGVSVTANAAQSPDGATSADALVEDSANSEHGVSSAASYTSGTSYTSSVFVKAAGRTQLRMLLPAAAFGVNQIVRFTLGGTGSVTTVSGTPTASITALANGWYRCVMTATASVTASGSVQYRLSSGSAEIYTGDGASGLYVWGAQIEAGASPSSYIPTTSAAATRSADTATIALADVAGWNASAGTVLVEGMLSSLSTAFPVLCSLNDGTANNSISVYKEASGSALMVADAVSGGVSQAALNIGTTSALSSGKVAFAFGANDFASSHNGAAVQSDTSGAVPAVTRLELGARAGALPLNGWLRRVAIYPRRLSNADLISLTSGA